MKTVIQKRFQLQLLFAMMAALSVAALTVELTANAIHHAESFVLADTNRALTHALHDLDREYGLRSRDGTSWSDLPANARDVTLRAISQTVLESYPGVEGGFWLNGQFSGYSYPTHDGGSPKLDVPAAERSSIEQVIAEAHAGSAGAEKVLRGRRDLVGIAARASNTSREGAVVWAMKRLPGQAEPAQRDQTVLLAALVGAGLVGAAGVLATGIGLNRGIAQIKRGLAGLDRDSSPLLPVRRDELGEISAAINQMTQTRRRLEAEVRREDRVRIVGHLVGRIAHEMKNPLNSIRLSLQMLTQRHEQGRLKSGDFVTVIEEVDRINRLLSDLLTFQQPRPPKLDRCCLGSVISDCSEMARPQAIHRGVALQTTDGPSHEAIADQQYLRQILLNLILNAIEASPPGAAVRIHSFTGNGCVALEVADQGPGLTPEQQVHLFEPFYTTKPSGHGLGLAVSRELARSMGGELSWRSEAGRGATFALQLKRNNDHQ